ncbi:MAG: hypothetical protein O3B41_00570 [Bacteroidetes bacterium]|nr:hypothetical protein [Bacteroidota bacterium]
MSNILQNIMVLGICWALATAGGIYVTFFQQPAEMERLTKAEQVASMKQAELSSLMAEMTESESRTSDVVIRWNARYKMMPRTLSSEDVVALLNKVTNRGFNPFDLSFKEHVESPQFNKFVFEASGRADFPSVYNLIWTLENSRELYRVDNLKLNHFDLVSVDPLTLRQKMEVMVSFSFTLEAFYGGVAGLSADDELEGAPKSAFYVSVDPASDLPPVPVNLLPARHSKMNPFKPLIMQSLPPNTQNLVDMSDASLVMIAGTNAIVEWGENTYSLGIGDSVYLGHVISVDPRNGTMSARLDKGGIFDDVELRIKTDALYKQARGNVELSPNQQ